MKLDVLSEFVLQVVVVNMGKVVDNIPGRQAVRDAIFGTESIEEYISLSYQFSDHKPRDAFERHSETDGAVFVLLGLYGAFDFRNVFVNTADAETDGEEISLDFLKLLVGMNLDYSESSCVVDFVYLPQFSEDGGFRPAQRE
jgi:hypothetical protein